MRRGFPCERALIAAVLLGLLSTGCRRSQVWLGRTSSATVSTVSMPPAADSGTTETLPTPGTTSDAGTARDAAGVGAVATPAAGSDGAAPAAASGSAPPSLPRLPTARGPCPELTNGEAKFAGITTRLWVGAERPGEGALMLYFHGTGSNPDEVTGMLGSTLDEILEQGGIVAALAESTGRGTDTGTGTWSTGDLETADEIVACVTDGGRIDPRRIYAAGCSAGGLTVGTMLYLRSSYLAGAQLNSGGTILSNHLEDPTHVPALIVSHGSNTSDIVIVNFAMLGAELAIQVATDGGFAVECDHGGGHCGTPERIREAQWQFLMAHPFGTKPSPYANGLPQGFPRECHIAQSR
ncbi:MAG TPA: hypothetical protein VFN67_26345 [Polyangiales bacterium]|nr:hypothetical protein [Polyangiales bacterium]